MIYEETAGEEITHAVALGFARCGARLRDLLLRRVKYGYKDGDDAGLTLAIRPCDAELSTFLSAHPESDLVMPLAQAFCLHLPHCAPGVTAKGKARLMHRLRTHVGLTTPDA